MKKTILVMLMAFAIIVRAAPLTSDFSQSIITYYDGRWITGWIYWGIATYDAPAVGAVCVDPGPYPYEFNLAEPLHVCLQIQHALWKPGATEENYLTIYLDGVPVLEADTIGLAWYPGGDGIELIDLGTVPAGTHYITMSATYPDFYAMDWFKILEFVYDVAVTNVVPSENQTYQLWTINVTVTVLNNGTGPANFNVTAYYENATAAYEIGTQTLNLAGGAEMNVTFTWNLTLTDVALGLYDVKANATLLPLDFPDKNLDNNEFVVYNATKVKLVGDIDGDADVDFWDLLDFCKAYGGNPQTANWNKQADFDGDDDVDFWNLLDFCKNYGKSTTAYSADP